MKQFIKGNITSFEDLLNKVLSGKRISFPVILPNGQQTKLIFEPKEGGTIGIKLLSSQDNQVTCECQSAVLSRLLHGETISCGNAREMKALFAEMIIDYENKSNENKARILKDVISINPTVLATELKEVIIGQDEQIEGICACVCAHLRKKNPSKPLTLMLPGPTGVGKTATARALVEKLKTRIGEDDIAFIYINCNELKEEYRVSQLIGSPAGYIGYGDRCIMEPIRTHARVVVLFDEYEKAESAIHTEVMNWMDTGIITLSKADENGQTSYNCAKSIFIMTSNIEMRRPRANYNMRFDINDKATSHTITDSRIKNDLCREAMVASGFKREIASRISYFFEYKALNIDDISKIMILSLKAKAKEFGCSIKSISDELYNEIKHKYKASSFGVRSFESDLDRILGQQLPQDLNENAEYIVGGTLEHMNFTEV